MSRNAATMASRSSRTPIRRRYATGHHMTVADLLTEDHRWPQFAPAAMQAGFASVHAVPLRAAGITLGALGLLGGDAGHLADADLQVARTLAHVACIALLQEHSPLRPPWCPDCAAPWPGESSSSRLGATCTNPSRAHTQGFHTAALLRFRPR